MQVVNEKKLSDWSYALQCRGCHSQLIVESNDLKHKDRISYYAYVNVVGHQLYVTCPSCNYDTNVPDGVIPDSIFDRVVHLAKAAAKPKEEKGWFRWYHVLLTLAAIAFVAIMCFVD